MYRLISLQWLLEFALNYTSNPHLVTVKLIWPGECENHEHMRRSSIKGYCINVNSAIYTLILMFDTGGNVRG